MPEEGAEQKTWFNNCAVPVIAVAGGSVGFEIEIPEDKIWDVRPFLFFPTGSLAATLGCKIYAKDNPQKPLWPDDLPGDAVAPGVVPISSGFLTGENSWAFGNRKSLKGGTVLVFKFGVTAAGGRVLTLLDIIERPIR